SSIARDLAEPGKYFLRYVTNVLVRGFRLGAPAPHAQNGASRHSGLASVVTMQRFLSSYRVRRRIRADWRRGFRSRNSSPFAHVPALHCSAGHVGIGLGEPLRDLGRVSFEKQHGAVDRICERSGEHEFSTLARLPCFFEMLASKLSAFGDIVLIDFVE